MSLLDQSGNPLLDQSGSPLLDQTTTLVVDGPEDFIIDETNYVTFEVYAMGGTPPYTYQWYETTAGLLAGETSNRLTLQVFAADNGNGYYCIVTDANSTAEQSRTGSLTVVTKPMEKTVDVRVKDTYGNWVSIMGTGEGGGDIINDSVIVSYLTWSSQKINSEIGKQIDEHINESNPHEVSHDELSGITPDDHHDELHGIGSHIDVDLTDLKHLDSMNYDEPSATWVHSDRMKMHFTLDDTQPTDAVSKQGDMWISVENIPASGQNSW